MIILSENLWSSHKNFMLLINTISIFKELKISYQKHKLLIKKLTSMIVKNADVLSELQRRVWESA